MFKEKNILYLLLLLIVIYFAQGAFYTSGSIISQTSLLLILSISGTYLFKTLLTKRKDLFYKVWTGLLLLNVLGFISTGTFSNPYHFGMFKGILISSLPFYPIYYFSRKEILWSKHLVIFFFVMLFISIFQFYYNREQILIESIKGNEDVVNNAAYMFVNLIPFVFLIKKRKIISLLVMLILVFYIIQGSKRGAILTGSVGVLIFIYYQLRTIDKKNRIRGYLLAIMGLFVLSYFAYKFYIENEYLLYRMQALSEGGFSGRDRIYFDIFNGWYYSDNLLNFIFGFGFAGSQKLTAGLYAHNDWLELLSNFGLIGLSIYMLLFYSAFKLLRNSNWNDDKRILFICVVVMWFLVTLFSMGYTSTGGYLRAIILAYLAGSSEKFELNQKY